MKFGIGAKLGLLASVMVCLTVLALTPFLRYHGPGVLWVKVGLTVGGVTIALLLSRRITRPLADIAAATRNLAEGDFDVQLPVHARDEIGALARCFKDMVDQLRTRGEQLRESEGRLRLILKTAADGVFILDEAGRIEMVNQAAERIFGYTADELKGQCVKLLIPKEVQGLPGPAASAASATSSIRISGVTNTTTEAVGRRKDGTLFPLELAVSDVAMHGRRIYTGIVRDVTERRRSEQEIRELNAHLRDLNEQLDRRVRERTRQLEATNQELAVARDQALDASRAKSLFLAQMSHELRTPLNAIKGYSELLLEELEERGQDDLAPDLQKVLQAGEHLLGLIDDVLDLSRVDSQRLELFSETFDVRALAEDAVAAVRPLLKKNNNRLEVRYGDDLGTLHADPARLRQVLVNLLSNAAKFTENGTVTLDARREQDGGAEWLLFVVSDTGIGIAAEEMAKLFRPFSQVDDTTTRKHGGCGLGLVLSRSFCRMMGGDVTADSVPGCGSTFTVRLPAAHPPGRLRLSGTAAALIRESP